MLLGFYETCYFVIKSFTENSDPVEVGGPFHHSTTQDQTKNTTLDYLNDKYARFQTIHTPHTTLYLKLGICEMRYFLVLLKRHINILKKSNEMEVKNTKNHYN